MAEFQVADNFTAHARIAGVLYCWISFVNVQMDRNEWTLDMVDSLDWLKEATGSNGLIRIIRFMMIGV